MLEATENIRNYWMARLKKMSFNSSLESVHVLRIVEGNAFQR